MPAYKDKAKGTWYASFYYEDWTGKKVKKMKRGFPTKREALEWERTFLQQQTADLEMTFENFVAVYVADMKGRIKENTWGTKEHILYQETFLRQLRRAVDTGEVAAAGFIHRLSLLRHIADHPPHGARRLRPLFDVATGRQRRSPVLSL